MPRKGGRETTCKPQMKEKLHDSVVLSQGKPTLNSYIYIGQNIYKYEATILLLC